MALLGYVSAASAAQVPPGSGEDSDDHEDGDEEPVCARERLPVTPPRSAGTEDLFGSHEDLPTTLQRALTVGPYDERDDRTNVATSHPMGAPSSSGDDRRPLVAPRPPAPVPKKVQRAAPAKKKYTSGGASGSGLQEGGATASGAHEAAGAQRQMGLYQQATEKRFLAVDNDLRHLQGSIDQILSRLQRQSAPVAELGTGTQTGRAPAVRLPAGTATPGASAKHGGGGFMHMGPDMGQTTLQQAKAMIRGQLGEPP